MITHKTTSQASRDVVAGAKTPTRKIACIKLAIDSHAAKLKVVRQLGDKSPQPAQSFTPEEFLLFAKKQLNLADEVHSCYEAGPTGFWLHRKLIEMGIKNLVVVAGRLDAYGRKVNNDRTDALALALKLSRYVAGEEEALAIVHVPTLEEEQRRAVTRQRAQFGKALRSLASMGRSLCLLHGHRLRGTWWRDAIWKRCQNQLPPWLVERLDLFRPAMAELEKQILALSKSVRASVTKPLPKGFGQLTYEQINREVVDWARFTNRKQPGSYAGLCGGVSDTGEQHADLPITKHGNARLRSILIELAWRWVIYQPQSRAVQRWKNILLSRSAHTRRRKQAIVALARQLLVDFWRWHTGKATPEKLGWKMTEISAAS
jgi:transposase